MPTCTILVGLPASGKTTYVKETNVGNVQVLSSDDILESIAERLGITYDEAFMDHIKEADKLFWDQLAECANIGYDIIIDRTNLSVKSRKRVIDFVNQYSRQPYDFHAKIFIATDAVLEARLASRSGKTIPKNVLDSMKSSYVHPRTTEGFTSVYMENKF